jgi:hypothetical protein
VSNHARRGPHRRPSPAATAQRDQADAAARHLLGVLHDRAQHIGQPVHHGTPGPVMDAVANRLAASWRARVLAAQPTLCPHLSYTAPSPAIWLAWAPELLRCPRCAEDEARRTHGTTEDQRCDSCARIVPVIRACMVEIPPLIVDGPGYNEATSRPRALLQLGLCPDCFKANGP